MNQFADRRRAYPVDATVETIPARDGWKLRHFRWPAGEEAALRGSILFAGGRGDFFEKYLEAFHHWHHKGWGVEAFDWRGQGGSGRLTAKGDLGHIEDFSIWIDDYADIWHDWIARTPGPHIVMGHSMGGQLVLRALGERRIAPDAAILIAPMLGFKSPVPNGIGQRVAHFMTRIGSPERSGWKHSEKPGAREAYRATLLTHSGERYEDEAYWWEQADLRTGPASWKWIEAAYRSMIVTARPAFLSAIETPVLILSATADKLVDPSAAVHAARHLRTAILHRYGPESAHEILREVDPVREDALIRIDAFLDTHAPPKED